MMAKKKQEQAVKHRFRATCPACGLKIEADTLDMMDSRCPKCETLLIINDHERLLSRTKEEFEKW